MLCSKCVFLTRTIKDHLSVEIFDRESMESTETPYPSAPMKMVRRFVYDIRPDAVISYLEQVNGLVVWQQQSGIMAIIDLCWKTANFDENNTTNITKFAMYYTSLGRVTNTASHMWCDGRAVCLGLDKKTLCMVTM